MPRPGEEIQKLQSDLEELRLESLLRGDYDSNNCYLSLHAGAGGTEAQDWTLMLYRMYTRYCERHGFTVKLIDMLDGDEAGLKSVTFEVDGENAYGFLRSEKGVHRLVRISRSTPTHAARRASPRWMFRRSLMTTTTRSRST